MSASAGVLLLAPAGHIKPDEQKGNDTMLTDKELENLWRELEDIPINPDTEEIEEDWNGFESGTDRESIWHWFDEQHSRGVAWLMYNVFNA